ncbi:MAG TPA: c-type cytochrome [Steroidobacteraceae bacterium]|nr:c-type cytochrome [Steroidobacteraceae bacterium]
MRTGRAPAARACMLATAVIGGAIIAAAASLAQNAPAASAAFSQCSVCHSIDGSNGTGPTLKGLIGRRSGTVPGFRYSRAMKSAAIVWDDATLDRYLTNPQELVPGNIMPFAGVAEARERAEVIAYLRGLR